MLKIGDNVRFKQENGIEVAIFLCEDGIRVKAESGQLEIFPDGDFWVAIKAITKHDHNADQLAKYDWTKLSTDKMREVCNIIRQ